MYTAPPLRDWYSCNSLGSNSPIILRGEATNDCGGMIIEERQNQNTHIHLHGDTGAAKRQFAMALTCFREYLYTLERHALMQSDEPRVSESWFQFELRQPAYRATLWGDGHRYSFYWVADHRMIAFPIRQDLRNGFDHLLAVYQKFFDTTIVFAED